MAAKEVKPKKLKVGSNVPVKINCAITGGEIIVSIPVVHEKDTEFLFKWKAEKWYNGLSEQEKQDIADEITRRQDYWDQKLGNAVEAIHG